MWLLSRRTGSSASVTMPMVEIGIMRVPVYQTRVPVPVRMRLIHRDARRVLMVMMVVMTMPVLVLHLLVKMIMLVTLR